MDNKSTQTDLLGIDVRAASNSLRKITGIVDIKVVSLIPIVCLIILYSIFT